MHRILFYCLMIAGVLSQNSAEPIACEIRISAVNQHPYHYNVPDKHQAPSVQVARSACARDREASWQHQVLAHYTKDDFARWATYKNISAEDLFAQHQLYQYHGFIELLRTYPEYEVRIAALYRGLVTKYERFTSRLWGYLTGTYTPGLYQHVAHEFKHVQERRAQRKQQIQIEQLAAERAQQEVRAAIKSHTRKSVQENQQSLEKLCATWQRYPNHTRLQKRTAALNTVVQNQDHHYADQVYQLDASIYQSTQYTPEQIKALQSCYGNAIQQTLHQEFVEIAHRSVTSSINHVLQKRFTGLLPELVTLGLDANNAGHVLETSALADCCWALLDCAHALKEGLVDGCCATAQSVIDAVTHPIDTATDLISSVATLLHTVASAVSVVPQLGYYYVTDTERYYLRQSEIAAYTQSLIEVVNNYVATTPRHQIICQSTSFITHAVLTDRLLKVEVHVVAKIPALLADILPNQTAAESVYALIATPGNATAKEKIPAILSGLEITPEIALHKKIAKAAQVLGPKSEELSLHLLTLEREIPNFIKILESSCSWLRSNNIPIPKIDWMHLFGMDLMPHKGHLKMGGFHHDYLGQLEKSGIIRIEILDSFAGGFYEAQVWVADTIAHPPKTFFPQNWTREQVVKCVIDTYQNCIKEGIKPKLQLDGKYVLETQITNGQNLRFYLDQKMNIKSVYPVFKGNNNDVFKINKS